MYNNNFDEIMEKIRNSGTNSETRDYLINSLTPEQNKKLTEVLSDKKTLEKLLSSQRAKDLMKKFTEGNND